MYSLSVVSAHRSASSDLDYIPRNPYASNTSIHGYNNECDPYATGQPDTDSNIDVYGPEYIPLTEPRRAPQATLSSSSPSPPVDTGSAGVHETYPAWDLGHEVPVIKEEIEDIFIDLTQRFGFQTTSVKHMFKFLMQHLEKRASRMSPDRALLTLHSEYIGGQHANYRKWYFYSQLGFGAALEPAPTPESPHAQSRNHSRSKFAPRASLSASLEKWRRAMNNMNQYDRVRHIALYMLLWGEAAQIQFMPEYFCFIFKCADDYYRSPECQNRLDPLPEGFYLRTVVQPLCRVVLDQGYKVVDDKLVRDDKHPSIMEYEDVHMLFVHTHRIATITLKDKTRLISLPPTQRFLAFPHIDWAGALSKSYYARCKDSVSAIFHEIRVNYVTWPGTKV